MRKVSKVANRSATSSGFTLLELMIVMAIMVLFISFIFGTFYIINASHARVAVLNDAKELASFNMEAIENLMINASDVILTNEYSPLSGYTVIRFDDSKLKYNDIDAFTFNQYTINTSSANKNKWDVSATFVKSATGKAVDVTVIIKDRSKSPATDFYKLTKTILLLNVKNNTGSQITVSTTPANVIKCKYPVL